MSEFAPIGSSPHHNEAQVAVMRMPGAWRGYLLAGWWRRMTAAAIDYLLTGLIARMITSPFGGDLGDNLDFIIWIALIVFAVGVNPWRIDFGKHVVGATTVRTVIGPNGPAFAQIGPGWRVVRLVVHIADVWLCFIGVFLIAFRWNRRTLADAVAGTVVIQYRPNEINLLPAEPFPGQLPRDRV